MHILNGNNIGCNIMCDICKVTFVRRCISVIEPDVRLGNAINPM